jgi:hypothetical protein
MMTKLKPGADPEKLYSALHALIDAAHNTSIGEVLNMPIAHVLNSSGAVNYAVEVFREASEQVPDEGMPDQAGGEE